MQYRCTDDDHDTTTNMKERRPDRIPHLKKICDESVLGEVVTGAMIQMHKCLMMMMMIL